MPFKDVTLPDVIQAGYVSRAPCLIYIDLGRQCLSSESARCLEFFPSRIRFQLNMDWACDDTAFSKRDISYFSFHPGEALMIHALRLRRDQAVVSLVFEVHYGR